MQHLTLAILLACIQLVKDTLGQNPALGHMGISQDGVRLLTQKTPWLINDRVAVSNVMTAMRDGMAAVVGYQPFKTPAEYVAAIIAHFVEPPNLQTACSWMAAHSFPATDLANDANAGSDPVSAQQLFALVLACKGHCPAFEGAHDSKVAKSQKIAERKNAGKK